MGRDECATWEEEETYHSRLGHLHDVGNVRALVGRVLHQSVQVGRGRTVRILVEILAGAAVWI